VVISVRVTLGGMPGGMNGLGIASRGDMLEGARREWHEFRDDEPGERFANHHERARRSSKVARVARILVGVVLFAGGIVMLFVPGPGLLAMLFGVALFAGESKWLAARMDRLEVAARRKWQRVRRRIRRRRAPQSG
jgi:hypothetical protein